jgi:Caspase domain
MGAMRALWLFLSAVILVACASASPPVALTPAPKAIAGLTFYVIDRAQLSGDMAAENAALESSLPDAVGAALTKAGFQVVTDKAQKHDAAIKVSANVTFVPSVFVMQVNGKIVKNARARVHLALEAGGARIDQVEGDTPGGNPSTQEALDGVTAELVNALEKSPRVAALAKKAHGGGEATEVADNGGDDPAPAAKAPKDDAAGGGDDAPRPAAHALAGAAQPRAYALIIGIEKYRDVPPPAGARGDAEKFAKLAQRSLGVPEENIRTAYDDRATKGDIEKQLRWLKANVEDGGRIYFYFSGHGAPDAASGTPYLLPYDGDPKFVDQTAIPLADVLAQLADTKAADVLAILDSCFSGAGGRSVLPPGARPLVRVKEAPVGARLAVLSASGGSEISGPVPGGTGGLFTHHVADGLSGQADADGDGRLSLKELYDFVKPRVAKDARRDNREQTPTLVTGKNVGDAGGFVVATFKGKK